MTLKKESPHRAENAVKANIKQSNRILTVTEAVDQFKAAMAGAGIDPPEVIQADTGKLVRFSTNGKRGDDSGWYVLHASGVPAGAFGSWRDGISHNWTADVGRKLTDEEIETNKRRTAEARLLREAENKKQQETAAEIARRLVEIGATAKGDHEYLVRKKIKAVPTLRELEQKEIAPVLGYAPKSKGEALTGRILIAPIMVRGNLVSCELIDEEGRKSAVYGGVKKDGYWCAQHLNASLDVICIGEGVATVLSVRESTGYPVAAALCSSNLESVAKQMRERYTGAKIVIIADLLKDTTEPDPRAIKAAQAVGGHLAIPTTSGTDFNDMHIEHGAEAVKLAIEAALSQEPKQDSEGPTDARPRLELIKGSSIQPASIDWMWRGWLARGKFHVLAGPPGTGKTTIATALAATLSSGGVWPNGDIAVTGNVLIWSGEDDPQDTLVPRLIASGCYVPIYLMALFPSYLMWDRCVYPALIHGDTPP